MNIFLYIIAGILVSMFLFMFSMLFIIMPIMESRSDRKKFEETGVWPGSSGSDY